MKILSKKIKLLGSVVILMTSYVGLLPLPAFAGIATLGFLTQGTDGSTGQIYYYTVDSHTFNFMDSDPWGVGTQTPLVGFAFTDKSSKFGSITAYNFFDASQQDDSYGGHDFVTPSTAQQIENSNDANPYWIDYMLDQNSGKIRIYDKDSLSIVPGSDSTNYYYANGYIMPWSGYHNATISYTDAGFQNSVNGGGWYEQYNDTTTWANVDGPPTLNATVTDPSGAYQAGDTWSVTANFTSPADAHNQIPGGYPSIHHYFATLWDSSGNFVKNLTLSNSGYNGIGIPLHTLNPSGYDPNSSSNTISVYNGQSATSGTDNFTISSSDTNGLQQNAQYTIVLYIMDDLHRYGVQKIPVTIGGGSSGGGTGTTIKGGDTDPAPSAVIKADKRGAEQFDVSLGIPTSETLYGNAFGKNYLDSYEFQQQTGQKQYQVKVSQPYTLTWTNVTTTTDSNGNTVTTKTPGSASGIASQTYTVTRKYSYWEIENLQVYGLEKAVLNNYALPNNSVTLTPNGYTPPTVSDWHSSLDSDHTQDPQYQKSITLPAMQPIDGGTSQPAAPSAPIGGQAAAENDVGQVQVRNDGLVFNKQTLMDQSWVNQDGPTPIRITNGTQVGQDVLYQYGLQIDPAKLNQLNAPSSGTIYYNLIANIGGGQSEQSYPIPGINTVTVYTATVNYPSVSDDRAHNQLTTPDYSRSAFILNRPSTITLPTTGQHQNYPGYGNRDYAKYIRERDVKFPFDVFISNVFHPKNTWIPIPKGQNSLQIYLPVWVDEGNYDVLFRSIAINSPSNDSPGQTQANMNLANYVATNSLPVQVIGRVFDFKVTDIGDYDWEKVFRTQMGSAQPTGNVYWVGTGDIDGNPRGNSSPFMLPIHPGSNPMLGYQDVSIKTGYHFKFDVKTIGNMYGLNDGIRITPSFYFVNKDGTGRQPVDVYYSTNDNPFVQIGSAQDTQLRQVTLNDPLRNVTQQEMTDTANFTYDELFTPAQQGMMSRTDYESSYITNASKPTFVGSAYNWQILPPALRTFIGNDVVPAGVDPERANASVQKWYGEYSLPAKPYVVPQGTNLAEYGRTNSLDDNSPIFLKNGYIIVNFNIETLHNQDIMALPRLQYIYAPLCNQWQMEGFNKSFTDAYGNVFQTQDGDVAYYDGDQSSYDDFGSDVTH